MFFKQAFASDNFNQALCKEIVKKHYDAVLLSEDGSRLEPAIKVGIFDLHTTRKNGEFFVASTRYRLILTRKSYVLEDGCSLDICTNAKKTPPHCPNSNEYLLEFGLNPQKFSPGHFESAISLRITDTKSGFPLEDTSDFSFAPIMSGDLLMPWLEIVESDTLAGTLGKVLSGNVGRYSVEVINRGNLPIALGKWSQNSVSNSRITMEGSSCENTTLQAQSSCKVLIINANLVNETETFHSWKNYSESGISKVELYLRKDASDSITYGIRNY